MTTTTAPLPLRGLDFSDWLSPMLVKELRQGLKTRVFSGAFIIVQAAMIILLGFRLLAQDGGNNDARELDAFLWIALGGSLLVIMPLRGLTAISEEAKANTLDLVQLTRMSSERIVTGKWVALVCQTLLLTIAVLPYLVLRYFFGSVNITEDLAVLGWMVAGSLVLTAGAVALSTAPMVTRVLILVFGIPAMFVWTIVFFESRAFGRGGFFSSSAADPSVWAILFSMAVTTAFLLALAASRVGAAAENHSTRMRLIVLVGLAAAWQFVWFDRANVVGIALLTPVILWSVVEALTESTSEVPSVYVPWVKRGLLGRLAGKVLYPGWSTGVLYTLLLIGVCFWLPSALISSGSGSVSSDQWQSHVATGCLLFGLLTPRVVMCFFSRSRQTSAWIYVLLMLGCTLYWTMFEIMDSFSTMSAAKTSFFDAFVPPAAFWWAVGHQSTAADGWENIALITPGVGILMLILLAFKGRHEARLMRRMEDEARTALYQHDAAAKA